MAKLKYEVLSPIRLADGELVPVGAVKSLEENDEDTQTFLKRDVIRLVPGQEDTAENDGSEQNGNPDETPETPASEKTLADLVGEDLASTLEAGGYESVEQVRAASNDELEAVEGIGKKSIEKIRDSLENSASAPRAT